MSAQRLSVCEGGHRGCVGFSKHTKHSAEMICVAIKVTYVVLRSKNTVIPMFVCKLQIRLRLKAVCNG